MFTLFAGHLAVGEVLVLWDRLVGYDSLLLLPILAVAIFDFRAESLTAATTADEARVVLADIDRLHVVPLLQNYLFRDGAGGEGVGGEADGGGK